MPTIPIFYYKLLFKVLIIVTASLSKSPRVYQVLFYLVMFRCFFSICSAFHGLPPEFIQQSPKLLQTVALVGIKFSNYSIWEKVHIVGSLGDLFPGFLDSSKIGTLSWWC